MSPQEFKLVWKDSDGRLSPISPDRLSRFSLAPHTMDFLAIAGLPQFAFPYLSFANDSDDLTYGINKLTDQFPDLKDDADYDRYVVIGSCRDGDPIAVDTLAGDTILQLDDEDYFKPGFFNSSIEALAHFLVIARQFEMSVLKEHGEEGHRNGYFTDLQFELLRGGMRQMDERALIERGFWKEELRIMLDLRQDYLDHGPRAPIEIKWFTPKL